MPPPSAEQRTGGADTAALAKPSGRSRTWIVVPAYNEAQVIADVLTELRSRGWNVIVVDDGSEDATSSVARRCGAVVARHVVNRGQGAAIQTGISFAIRAGADFVVTFDSDGQHSVDDLPRVLSPLVEGRAEIVLGSRFLGSSSHVPKVRALLLKAGVLFTRTLSGMRVTDVHNGFRAFTRLAACQIEITLDRMAHASELLDQIAASGLRYVEVPVEIRYTSYSIQKGQRSIGALRILTQYLLRRLLG